MKKILAVILALTCIFPTLSFADVKDDLKISNYIEHLNDSNLIRDNTSDNNLRYTGLYPNNYVSLGSYEKTFYQSYAHGDFVDFVNRGDSNYVHQDFTQDQCNAALENTIDSIKDLPIDDEVVIECRKKENDSYYLYFEAPSYLFNTYEYPLFLDLDTCNDYNEFVDNYIWIGSFTLLKGWTTCKQQTKVIDEKWRIVGVFNEDDSKKVKLVRDSSINYFYPGTCNSGFDEDGLEEELTGYKNRVRDYLNDTYINGKKFNLGDIDIWNHTRDQRVITFNKDMLKYVEKHKWTISSLLENEVSNGYNIKNIYNKEKSSKYSYNDYVGLISDSDILYSANINDKYIRSSENYVNSYILSDYKYDSYSNFIKINHGEDYTAVAIDPIIITSGTTYDGSFVRTNYCEKEYCDSNLNGFGVKPTVFLKDDLYVVSGTGSYNDPYILATEEKTTKVNIQKDTSLVVEDLVNNPNVSYKIGDTDIIKIEDGTIIPLKPGKTTVTYYINDTLYIIEVEIPEADTLPDNPATGLDVSTYFMIIFIAITLLYISTKRKRYI